ncbi:MAG: exodeoxyribonuclease III [Chloroflexi bacterium]|nr:exodeoxyribonuclease III [Chloroflexota bacterium]MCY3582436.1 exodeoxyribonuclease III [Chloroflexota bacterium]MCY3716992.1 exodeoxyribonuclease III [Chloroflexota bacterium]MDE2652086.1 exodeoxyribonuclease III [Chloroflexota bacterium]MXV93811.1 exodeoxyribonuclease III [Chloroflexota bacterium]
MKLISWNVNGIRAAQRKGFLDWLGAESPDVLTVQETKAHPEQLAARLRQPEGYQSWWASAERKGYSGVGLFSKSQPRAVQVGLGIEKFDSEGRTLSADFGDFTLISTYLPNGKASAERLRYKMEYKEAFLDYAKDLRAAGKSVVFCGDINTAHNEIDLTHPKPNAKHSGFLREERDWIDNVLAQGYIDIYRHRNPDKEGAYTWWSLRSGARAKNVGWRIDYFFISSDLLERVVAAEIHPDVMGSDHCPISLTLDF